MKKLIISVCLSLIVSLFSNSRLYACEIFPLEVLKRLDNGNYSVSFVRGQLKVLFEEDDFAALARAAAESVAYSQGSQPALEKVLTFVLERRYEYLQDTYLPFLQQSTQDGSLSAEQYEKGLNFVNIKVMEPLAAAIKAAKAGEYKAAAHMAIESLLSADVGGAGGSYAREGGGDKVLTREIFPDKLGMGMSGCNGKQFVELLGFEKIQIE